MATNFSLEFDSKERYLRLEGTEEGLQAFIKTLQMGVDQGSIIHNAGDFEVQVQVWREE